MAGPPADERALFAGTAVRFAQLLVLLVVASAGLAMNVGYSLGNEALTGCVLAAGIDYDRPSAGLHVIYGTHAAAWEACIDRHMFAPPSWFGLAWAGLIVAVAAGLFRAMPRWKAARRGVVPLGERDTDPEDRVRRRLDTLRARAGLAALPTVLVDRAAPTASAVVFGSDRRPVLRLDGGLLAADDPDRFDAVILHEFGHIKGRDITVTYATVALWWSFAALALAPYTVSYLLPIPHAFGEPWQGPALLLLAIGLVTAALLTALVYLARAEVLRTRECCADIAARDAGGAPHGWAAATPARDEGRLRLGSFVELWRVHPPKDLRRHTLAHPAVLFELHAVPLLLTGAVAVIAAEQLRAGVVLHGSWRGPAEALLGAGLITGVTGLALWRAVANPAPAPRRRRPPTGVRAGLWLGLGMAAGSLPASGGGLRALPAHPEYLLLMVLAGIGFGWWTTQCARAWTDSRPGADWPMWTVLAGAWALMTAWLAWWRSNGMLLATGVLYDSPYVRDVTPLDLDDGTGPVYTALVRAFDVLEPVWVGFVRIDLVWAALAVLWAVPLLAWAAAPRRTALPPLRRVLLAGAIGAACCWAVVAVGLARMSPWVPFGTHQLIAYLLLVAAGLVLGAAAAALAASLLARRLRLAQSLIAAHLAAAAGLTGVVALMAADGCIAPLAASQVACGEFPLTDFLLIYEMVVPQALVLAAVAASAVTAVVAAAHRLPSPRVLSAIRVRRAPTPARTRTPTPARLYARRLAIGLLCGAAAGFVLMASVLQAAQRPPATDPAAPAAPAEAPAAPAAAPETRAVQIEAWREYGGDTLITDFTTALDEADALALSHNDIDLPAARSTCTAVLTAADGAAAFFPVPDGPAQGLWSSFTADARTAATECVQAVDRENPAMLADALEHLHDTAPALAAATTRLDDLQHP